MLYNNDLSAIKKDEKQFRIFVFIIFLVSLIFLGYGSYKASYPMIFILGGIASLAISLWLIRQVKTDNLDILPLPYDYSALTDEQKIFIRDKLLWYADPRVSSINNRNHALFNSYTDCYDPYLFFKKIAFTVGLGKSLSCADLLAINLFFLEPHFEKLGIEKEMYYIFSKLHLRHSDIKEDTIKRIFKAPDRETLLRNIDSILEECNS